MGTKPQDRIRVGGDKSVNGTITVQMVKEVAEKLRYVPLTKELFFEKFFPDIEDCTDWEIIIPEKLNENGELDFLKHFKWVNFTGYAELVLAWNPKLAWSDLL